MVLPSPLDLLDILLVAGVLWLLYRTVVRTRARKALIGGAILAALFLLVRALDLTLMALLLQGFAAVAILVLVVVFQEDLRRLFEDLGSFRPDRRGRSAPVPATDVLVRTVARLASTRTGALIVVPGLDPVDLHLTGGVPLGGRVSEPLLLSLFDSSSPGHDGALVLRGDTIERFAAHLPLSANHSEVGPGGTRHAAGLGLSERCDATIVIVSEERGTISVAKGGVLRKLSGAEALLEELAVETRAAEPLPLHHRREVREGAIALAAALLLWGFLVPGAEIVERTVPGRIVVHNLPPDLRFVSSDPTEATLVVRGPRRALLLAERGGLEVRIDAYLARLGRRTFSLETAVVQAVDGVAVASIQPDRVRVDLEPVPAPLSAPGASEDENEPGDAAR